MGDHVGIPSVVVLFLIFSVIFEGKVDSAREAFFARITSEKALHALNNRVVVQAAVVHCRILSRYWFRRYWLTAQMPSVAFLNNCDDGRLHALPDGRGPPVDVLNLTTASACPSLMSTTKQ